MPSGKVVATDLAAWFDPGKQNHMKAVYLFLSTGKWPDGFPPDGVDTTRPWAGEVLRKYEASCRGDAYAMEKDETAEDVDKDT